MFETIPRALLLRCALAAAGCVSVAAARGDTVPAATGAPAAEVLPPLPLETQPTNGLTRAEATRRVEALTDVGRRMFFDPSLSASGQLSCATCHSPAAGFAPANADPVQTGGVDGHRPGLRAAPSLTYLQLNGPFTPHYYESEDDGDESIDAGPTGGLTWDGRADLPRDQARIPLLTDFEMANASPADVVRKARAAGYVDTLQHITHDDSLAQDDTHAFDALTFALEVYQQDYKTFFPFTSKYDAVLAHRATLTAQEQHGLELFNDPAKGNCANCHISAMSPSGAAPMFTDHGLIALGLPRNPAIPANADPNYYDLGLCGPLRTDYKDTPEYCGLFETPSLRNVALRQTFMHNGELHSLRDAVAFYVERDTKPEKWYPRAADGTIEKYNDLPPQYRANVNDDPPFGEQPGNKPLLSDAEIDDIVAFLKTLSDGYDPTPKSAAAP